MSNQRDEDFDSIYASIEDDDVEEMYVDVSSNEGYGGPSPYVYPQAPLPPSPSVRKLPPLPVKSTVGAASKPPWPRKPQPPPNQPSIKIPKKEPNRDVPQPLPRVGTMKKKGPAAEKPLAKSRQVGYSPPPPVVIANSGGRQAYPGYQQYSQEASANTAILKTRYQDSGFGSGKDEPRYKLEYAREPPSSTGQKLLHHQPPPPNNPPPPPRDTNGQNFTGQILNTPNTEEESEYESLRPARQRILRGFGQQSRRSRQYSDDRIPLQDMASNHEDSMSTRGYQSRREKEGGGGESVQNNSRIVCILLTIIVIALLISLMSLVMSLYTLTRFELSRRVNNNASECDIKVSNCTTDSLDLVCINVS